MRSASAAGFFETTSKRFLLPGVGAWGRSPKSFLWLGGGQDSISGQNISLARAVYYRRLTPRSFLPLDLPVYLGGSLERGRAWNNDDSFDSGYINAASIFISFDTPLGPLDFSYGLNDEAERALYLNLGRVF